MKALISPLENNRICQIEPDDATFPIAEPLYWIDCPDDCDTTWSYINGQFYPPKPYEPTADENYETAVGLLNNSDWATRASVSDPAISNPYLTNQTDWFQYQNAVRQIALNPVAGNLDWPVQPTATWSA